TGASPRGAPHSLEPRPLHRAPRPALALARRPLVPAGPSPSAGPARRLARVPPRRLALGPLSPAGDRAQRLLLRAVLRVVRRPPCLRPARVRPSRTAAPVVRRRGGADGVGARLLRALACRRRAVLDEGLEKQDGGSGAGPIPRRLCVRGAI